MTKRYDRHIVLPEIGEIGQQKISAAKVLVTGAGGLGCPVLQYLAAAGVGTLGIIDFDTVALSNLQRQVLYGTASLGKHKAIAAKERLQDLNPDITINTYPEALTYKNALLLFNDYDIIVDGSDNFETRYLINDACVITNKPLVFGAIYKFEGQVSVFNYKNGPTYRCVFPKAPQTSAVPNCSEIGVLGVLPGIIGSMQANEVLKLILDLGDNLSGKLLLYNALNAKTSILKINRNNVAIQAIMDSKNEFQNTSITLMCEQNATEISITELDLDDHIQLIDVREKSETPQLDVPNVVHIPLSEIEYHIDTVRNSKTKAIFCQSGKRSKQAIAILNANNITHCVSIKESASEIKTFLENYYNTQINVR